MRPFPVLILRMTNPGHKRGGPDQRTGLGFVPFLFGRTESPLRSLHGRLAAMDNSLPEPIEEAISLPKSSRHNQTTDPHCVEKLHHSAGRDPRLIARKALLLLLWSQIALVQVGKFVRRCRDTAAGQFRRNTWEFDRCQSEIKDMRSIQRRFLNREPFAGKARGTSNSSVPSRYPLWPAAGKETVVEFRIWEQRPLPTSSQRCSALRTLSANGKRAR